MKRFKKVIAALFGLCLTLGMIAANPVKVEAAGPNQVYVSEGQTVTFPKGTNNIYVKDQDGSCVAFTAYYYDAAGKQQGYAKSSKGNDNAYDSENETVYADNYYTTVTCRLKDGSYIVDIYADNAPSETPSDSPESVPGTPSCNHDYEWVLEKEATETANGILAYECTKCGHVHERMDEPNSAFMAFNRATAKDITNAAAGETVTVSTKVWTSFEKTVLDALAARPDVSLTVNYRYQGIRYTVTIPAGSDAAALADENGYCGFRYLDGLFGGSLAE